MTIQEHVSQVVYVSRAAPSVTPSTLDDILAKAHVFNAKHGLTGFLTYDGASFCQLLEGPQDALDVLMERITDDRRHDVVRPIWSAQGERFLPRWSMHYERFDHAEEFVRDQVRSLIQQQGEQGPSREQVKQLVLGLKLKSVKRR